MAESEEKDYKVSDRRYLHMSEEEKARVREEEAAQKKAAEEYQEAVREWAQEGPLPEMNFASFIISLSSSAFVHLGDMPDPATGEVKKNLPLAKQTIDLLGLLREKTRNNLLEEEEKLFDHLLYDLRMRYVKEAS
jgi:hypothetical protein